MDKSCEFYGENCFLKRFGIARTAREKDLMETFCAVHKGMMILSAENEEMEVVIKRLREEADEG